MHIDSQTLTVIFVIATAVGVLLQAGILLGMLIVLLQVKKKILPLAERLEEQVTPIIANTRSVVADLTPKVKTVSANVVDMSGTLREKAVDVGNVVTDISSRTKHQSARIDTMVTGTLNSIGQATAAVEKGIQVPLRQVNGVLNGIRAGFETLRNGSTHAAGGVPTPSADPERTKASAEKIRETADAYARESGFKSNDPR